MSIDEKVLRDLGWSDSLIRCVTEVAAALPEAVTSPVKAGNDLDCGESSTSATLSLSYLPVGATDIKL